MTTTHSGRTSFRIHTILTELLNAVRTSGLDASRNPVERLTAEGGEPLRCCLRDARPGEALILFGYEPPMPASPYREIGAVLTHAAPCPGPDATDSYPPDWYGRRQVLRAYDRRGWIHDATVVHDGDAPEVVIAKQFADPEVAWLHSRNVAWGCWMFTVTRAD